MTVTSHLDRLAEALIASGWCAEPRYTETPPLLRVFSPDLPGVGESVWVKPGVGGVPWFIASTGDPLAPCHDPVMACAEIAARLKTSTGIAAVVRVRRLGGFAVMGWRRRSG
jgi:hypothetical protein